MPKQSKEREGNLIALPSLSRAAHSLPQVSLPWSLIRLDTPTTNQKPSLFTEYHQSKEPQKGVKLDKYYHLSKFSPVFAL